MIKKIFAFIKKEIVLSIASVLAIITCFIVPIDREYLGYFDYNTLMSLFCILTVVVGLKSTGVFELISKKIIELFHTRRSVITALVFGTFFFDMIVANDMSLITFLPLTYIILHTTKNDKYLMITFILQTIAANMGGMITPYGNPQNLYLFSFYNISVKEFMSILIVQSSIVALLLFICCRFFIKNAKLEMEYDNELKIKEYVYVYVILFVLVILAIFRLIPLPLVLVLVVIDTLLINKKLFKDVDYALLATFCVFFIFSGNMARIPFIKDLISQIVVKNTLLAGVVSCQFISNVPTAIFLSKFTGNYQDLLIAVNIGSLGILISSLASLITLKEFLKHQPKKLGKYIGTFTLVNTTFLIIVLLVTYLVR